MPDEYQEYKGIVTGHRNLGGLVFLDIRLGRKQIKVIARKSDCDTNSFDQINSIRSEDFVHIKCQDDGEDCILLEVIHVIKPSGENDADGNRKRTIVLALDCLLDNVRLYLRDKGYVEVRLPSIHFGQGKGYCFNIDYFGQRARLSSSNALFLSVAATKLVRCYSLQRIFRAEPSKTSKHLAEFDMIEVAVLGNTLDEAMLEIESLIHWLPCANWPKAVDDLIPPSRKKVLQPFRRLLYDDVEKSLNLNGRGLGKHEKGIAANGPTFVVDFPRGISSWAARDHSGRFTRTFNLLMPEIGEIAEGSERNTDMKALQTMFQQWMLTKQLGWYAKGIRYDKCDICIFGLGLERLALWLFGLNNIRDTTMFYRDKGFSEIE